MERILTCKKDEIFYQNTDDLRIYILAQLQNCLVLMNFKK